MRVQHDHRLIARLVRQPRQIKTHLQHGIEIVAGRVQGRVQQRGDLGVSIQINRSQIKRSVLQILADNSSQPLVES